MAIILYEYYELEERYAKSLRKWKACHITLYAFAAIFGILNFAFLQNLEQLFDDHCVLFPKELVFRMIELPTFEGQHYYALNNTEYDEFTDSGYRNESMAVDSKIKQENSSDTDIEDHVTAGKVKREVDRNVSDYETSVTIDNVTTIIGNRTHRLMLDTGSTVFRKDGECQYTQYMPLLSAVFAVTWLTLFISCPAGGEKTGVKHPWRILAPALIFSIVLLALTCHSLAETNAGIHALCEGFQHLTNTTNCYPVSQYVERAWNSSWDVGARVSAVRVSCAASTAAWACAAALAIARCLAAPDFNMRRTAVCLQSDPKKKIVSHLRRSNRKRSRSSNPAASPRQDTSIKSEPTNTSELIIASIENERPLEKLTSTENVRTDFGHND